MSYTQVTLLQFRTDLLSMVETVPYWSSAQANTAINEALKTWNLLTGQWKVRVPLPTIQNTHWLSTPAGILCVFRLIYRSFPLYKTSWFDLDYGRTGWQGQTTATSDVPTAPSLWCMMGLNYVGIWPSDSNSSPSNMVADGVATAPLLSSDLDYVDIGREEQGAILSYALHKLSFKEGGPRFEASMQHLRRFYLLAAMRNARLRAATFYKAVMIGYDPAIKQKPMDVAKVAADEANNQNRGGGARGEAAQ